MNDKPSKQPPAAFIGAEDAMEQYDKHFGADEKDPMIHDAGIEGDRPSSTFRFGKFGKVVANVLGGFWKEKEPPVPPPKDAALDDRKAKAEDAYAVLKSKSFKGMQPCSAQRSSQDQMSKTEVEGQNGASRSFRDSGIDINESQRSSLQTIRTMNVSEGLKPPSETASKRSVSPASGTIPGRRSTSLHLRTPSFQSLKKVKSQIHVPSIVRPAEKAAPLAINDGEAINDHAGNGLRRQPSKKDLARYQKLSKKVSDLESKLETARRDLEKSLKDAPPVPDVPNHLARKPFTPGALPSLPSERLLSSKIATAVVAQTNTDIYGPAVVSSVTDILSSPSRQLDYELNSSFNKNAANDDEGIEALMSSDPIARPDINGVDHASWNAAQAAKIRRKPSRRLSEQQGSLESRISAGFKKPLSTNVPTAPKNSPIQMDEITPPMPAVSITADQADKPRPESPFLGRPVATSPVRTRSKAHKRKTPPPPSNQASALKRNRRQFTIHDDDEDTALTPDSAAGNRQKQSAAKGSPAPKAVQLKAARAKAVKVSMEKKQRRKSSPEIQAQQEEFVWDEDVF